MSKGPRGGLGAGLAILSVALLACVLIPAYAGMMAMNSAEDARESQDDFHELQLDVMNVSSTILEIQSASRGYSVTGEMRYVERAHESLDLLKAQFAELRAEVRDISDSQLSGEVEASLQEYLSTSGLMVRELADQSPAQVRARISTGEGQRRIDRTRAVLTKVENHLEAEVEQAEQQATESSDRLRIAQIVATLAILVAVGLMVLFVLKAVRRPIVELESAADEIGLGNYTVRVEPGGVDEIESLGRSFNSMADQLESQRKELEFASQAKTDFLARMSHELRTPLNAILGFGQLLDMDDLSEEQKASVAQILRAGSHLLSLIDEVLDISRIESGSLRISMEPVSLRMVCADVKSMVAPFAAEREVELRVDQSEEEVFVRADQQRLKQILLNLLSNGIKYNRLGGRVDVHYEVDPKKVRIFVSDTGRGIPAGSRDQLFIPFERLGIEEKTSIEGTGLGLALSRRLAELMDGSLELVDSSESGSVFSIELIRTEGNGNHHEESDPISIVSADSVEIKVVVIEDNTSNYELVDRILAQHHRAKTYPAIQGSIGIDLVRRHRPDLVLLDLHLPDMRGDEVLGLLKADPETASIPVMILSADATSGHQRRLVEAGAECYLTKPLDVREFLSQVDKTLGLNDGV